MSLLVIKRFILLIIKALLTEKMMMRLMVMGGDWLVEKSSNKLDDKIWPNMKKALEESVAD
ncbi:hypothetical protein LCGC14_2028450 [marine sediment metagenome]|uniref:Uncharacterized protein n=1 Tax=marine sediment metagenome TaxID=412755 RepID=A0A0F9EVA6_9ZZZZ